MTGVVFKLLLVALLAGWVICLRPSTLGGPVTYVMVNGTSMEPTFHDGDMAIVRKQSSYGVGDIIAYHIEGGQAIVIHRIVGGDGSSGFETKGDNRSGPDTWRPTHGQIVGKMWVAVPGAGRYLAWIRSPLPLAAIAGALATTLVLLPASWPRRWSPFASGAHASRDTEA